MNPVLLDTHALAWLLAGDESLGLKARALIDRAAREDAVLVSAMSFWEVAMLARRGRLALTQPTALWRTNVLQLGVREVAVSGDIGILATELDGFHPDPADRIISATALTQGAVLVTADERILDWKGTLDRCDARV